MSLDAASRTYHTCGRTSEYATYKRPWQLEIFLPPVNDLPNTLFLNYFEILTTVQRSYSRLCDAFYNIHSVTLVSPFFSVSFSLCRFVISGGTFILRSSCSELLLLTELSILCGGLQIFFLLKIRYFSETSLSDNIVRFHRRSRCIVAGMVANPDPH
jgi:hypothetical protein